MAVLNVNVPSSCAESYPIRIDAGLFDQLSALLDWGAFGRVVVISDDQVAPLWLKKLQAGLPVPSESVVIPSGEENKNIDTVSKVWKAFAGFGVNRDSLILNLGGGVVGDLGGFAAAAYMRGIPFIQVPTSLLAQVDASVGGKVGIDYTQIKNLVGFFAQPLAVWSSLDTLESLPRRELVAAFAEIIKHGLIADPNYLRFLEERSIDSLVQSDFEYLVRRSCELKAAVVAEDPKEAGVRKILNFGHTIGHAIEGYSHEQARKTGKVEGVWPLLHGEAVAFGILTALELSEAVGTMDRGGRLRVADLFRRYHLPTELPREVAFDSLKPYLRLDKKNRRNELQFVLLTEIGRASFGQVVAEADLAAAWKTVFGLS